MVESRPNSDFKTYLQKAPRNGAVDGFPCKLYINGEFWGLYTWNIPKDEWMFNMDSDNPKHMVLCAEQNNNRLDVNDAILKCEFRQEWDGSDGSSWSIEVGTLSDDLKNSFNRVVRFVMNSSDEEFRNNINDYFDLYSLIDYYLFSYFACHLDGLAKNMLIGTYDGVQWGVMLYDMDSIFGAHVNGASFVSPQLVCPSGYQENNSLLWQRLEKCFIEELKTRYAELRKGALSLGNVITHVEEIHDLVNDRTFNDEKSKWTQLPSVTTNTMSRFRNYMRDRAK
jgi:1,4-alpha-glucan branching enzyme